MSAPTSRGRRAGDERPRLRLADVVLDAVRFAHERSRTPIPFHGPVSDLVGRHHVARQSKSGTPTFSTVRYAPGKTRGKKNVLEATALVFDFDHLSSESAEQVWRRLRGRRLAFVAYSSYSHQADGRDDCCFRILLFPTRPVRPGEFERVWRAVNEVLGSFADTQARDISRIWYVASCPPERIEGAWVRAHDGYQLDVDQLLSETPAPRPRGRARAKTRGQGGPIAQGDRNSALTSLAGAARRKGAGHDEILELLRATNATRCEPPVEHAELERIVESVSKYDPASPLLSANRTDLGNAERFEAFAGHRLRFCHPWGCWLVFDGRRWHRDLDGEAVRGARDTLRALAAEAQSIPDEDHRAEVVKHALDSESSARVTAMLSLAQSLLPVSPEALDTCPDLLNVANGTLDLRTGELRPHHRDDLLTKLAPVSYNPEAECPRWEGFLERILGGKEQLITFLQRAVGYSLSGSTTEQILLLLYGTGANGKSTFLETLRLVAGDYATIADFTTFLKRDTEGARNDLARLVGTRFVSAVEAEAGRRLDEALVKQLTGGDTITARFLFKEFFDFKPQFKIWLAANHKPNIAGTDHGIWRRIRLVPFTVTIPPAEQDKRLPELLKEELPGILAWAIRGCLAWRQHGLGVPAEVRAATASYRDEMDVFGGFLDERCVADEGAHVTSKDLNAAYKAWCEANSERPRSSKALARALRERGCASGRLAKGVRCWKGVRLRRENDPVAEGDGWRMGDASSGISAKIEADPSHAQQSFVDDLGKNPDLVSQPATRHPSGTRNLEVEEGEL